MSIWSGQALRGLLVLLCLGSISCHDALGLSLDTLDPAATHFVWLTKTEVGRVAHAELVRRGTQASILVAKGDALFVFPVYPEQLAALGFDAEELPAAVELHEASPCEPALSPRSFFRARDLTLESEPESAVSLAGVELRACSGSPPDLRFHGSSGGQCEPRLREVARCEYAVDLDSRCQLPSGLRDWVLFEHADGRACAAPRALGPCETSEGTGRILTETHCPDARAVVSRATDDFDVRVAAVPGNPQPSYADSPIQPGDHDQLYLRLAFVPDLVRLPDGALIVASSSGMSNPTVWDPGNLSTLHRIDPVSLEVLSSSSPMPFEIFGLHPDGDAVDSVLAAVTSTRPDELRLARLGLDGTERASQHLASFIQNPEIGEHVRYVDTFKATEIDSLVVLLAYQQRSAPEIYRYWVELVLLDPRTLREQNRFDSRDAPREQYAVHALQTPLDGRVGLALTNDEIDAVSRISFDQEGPLSVDSSIRFAEGGGATMQYSLLYESRGGASRLITAISSDQRSWRSDFGPNLEMQAATGGVPTLLAPIGAELILAPQLHTPSGDLELMLLEPTRLDVFSTKAPTLVGVGPPGRVVTDERGTVWMTLPWTGQLARVAPRAP